MVDETAQENPCPEAAEAPALSAPAKPDWGVADVVVVGICGLVFFIGLEAADFLLTAWLEDGMAGLLRGRMTLTPGLLVRSIVIQNATFVGVCLGWLAARRVHPAALGLRSEAWRRRLWVGALAGVGLCALGILIQLATEHSLRWAGQAEALRLLQDRATQAAVAKLFGESALPLKVAAVLGIAAIAPLGEEILFRGFIYQGFKRHLGARWGALISSLLFATLHFNPLDFIALFVIGLALVRLFERTGTLTAPIAAHCLNNLIGTLLILFFPNLGI